MKVTEEILYIATNAHRQWLNANCTGKERLDSFGAWKAALEAVFSLIEKESANNAEHKTKGGSIIEVGQLYERKKKYSDGTIAPPCRVVYISKDPKASCPVLIIWQTPKHLQEAQFKDGWESEWVPGYWLDKFEWQNQTPKEKEESVTFDGCLERILRPAAEKARKERPELDIGKEKTPTFCESFLEISEHFGDNVSPAIQSLVRQISSYLDKYMKEKD